MIMLLLYILLFPIQLLLSHMLLCPRAIFYASLASAKVACNFFSTPPDIAIILLILYILNTPPPASAAAAAASNAAFGCVC